MSFSSNQATGKVLSTEYAMYSKIIFIKITPHGEAVNYIPQASPSFQPGVASPSFETAIQVR